MGINKSYLFVLLLASLSTLCTSDCPTTAPASINQSAQTPYQECAKLYAVLEAALLENLGNLYQLHYRFFPISSIEPLYALVSFKLNDQHNICWTSSVVLRSVDPSITASFQVLLLNILLPLDTSGQRAGITYIQLSIKPVNFTESDYPNYNTTIDAVLQDFTSLLKVYASTRQSRSHWTAADFKYEGYICEFDSTLGALLVSIAILTVVLTTLALIKAAPKLYEELYTRVEPTADRNEHWYSFFWAASFMATVCNIYALWEVLYLLIDILYSERYGHEYLRIYVIKVVILSSLILLDILVACCIPKRKEFPIPRLAYILSFPLCCTFCCCSCHCHTKESSSEKDLEKQKLEEPQQQHSKKQRSKKHHPNILCSKELRSKWIQTLALSSLFFFTQIVALSALSTILWAFIFPIQLLAAISFLAAGIFCATALIALLLRNIGQITFSKKCCSLKDTSHESSKAKWWSILQPPLLILMVTLFLAIVILTFYVHIKFITSGIEMNQVGGFIFTFLPSAILTIIGWFVSKGKFIEQLFPQKSKHQSDPQNQNNVA